MSGQPRPWWASSEEGADPAVDAEVREHTEQAFDRHRAARRGSTDPDDEQAWWDAAVAGVTELADRLASAAQEHAEHPDAAPDDQTDADDAPGMAGRDVCGSCPICSALRALHAARPELAEHLGEAARHLSAALRDLIEHPPGPPRRDRGAEAAGDDTLERIDLERP